MMLWKTCRGTRIDPYPHGADFFAEQKGLDPETAVCASARSRRINLAVRLVARYLRQMVKSEAWSRSRKKKAAALSLAAIIVNPDELRVFINAAFSDKDGDLVDVWVASHLKEHYGVDVSNVTVATVLSELEDRIDALVRRKYPHVQR